MNPKIHSGAEGALPGDRGEEPSSFPFRTSSELLKAAQKARIV